MKRHLSTIHCKYGVLNFAKSGLLCQIKEYCDKLSVFTYYDLIMICIQLNNANKYLINI